MMTKNLVVEIQNLIMNHESQSVKFNPAGVFQSSILGPTNFVLYICDVICNIAICADDATLYSKCDQASDLWQQLELASDLDSNL